MSSLLHIKLLGGFSLSRDHQPIAGISSERSQALLAYLVLYRQTPQLRQKLAFQLWSDSSETQARANLRKELSHLRRLLPPDEFFLVDAKTLQWRSTAAFKLDVAEFEAAIAAAQTSDPQTARLVLEQAIALYSGDLLPHCDQDWLLPERERLRQTFLQSVEQLVNLLEQHRDYRSALNYAQLLLRADSLNEAAYRTLIRLYAVSGDRANALQIYHRCMTVLREELGIDPGPTTRKLYEQVLCEDLEPDEPLTLPSTPQPVPTVTLGSRSVAVAPLVGRHDEWQAMRQWLETRALQTPGVSQPAAESTKVLFLLGEPGIGKTRLLEELKQQVVAEGQLVLWGRGFESELMRPYGIWIDAMRSLPPELQQFSSDLSFLSPQAEPALIPTDRSRLFDAVVQFLAQLGQDLTVTLVFDDVQWIDEASCALLHYAIRLLKRQPIRFACAARSQELIDQSAILRVVQALRREGWLQPIELSPLTPQETVALIDRFSSTQAESDWLEVAERISRDSGGNPLFAIEMARAAQQKSPHANPVELLIRDRLQRLSDSAQELLPWAAALGSSFQPAIVAQVADYPLAKLLLAIEQLEQQNIIQPSDAMRYDFVHDIVRQVAYQQLSEPRRRLVHLQIAHKLHQSTEANGEIAYHASLGGDWNLASTASLAAAEHSLKLFAYAEAAALAQRGIQACQALDQHDRIGLHLKLLQVWVYAGVTGEQATEVEVEVQRLLSEANHLGLKDEEAIGLTTLLVLHFDRNNLAEVQHHSQQAAEKSRTASPATAARMLAYSGSCLAEIGRDMARAEALLLEAQSLADRIDLQLTDIACGLGCVQRYRANYAAARTLLQQAWHMAQLEQDHWRECCCLSYLAMIEIEAGDPTAALPYCSEMATVAEQMKEQGSETAFATGLTALAQYLLQPAEAATALARAIALLQQIDAKRMLAYLLTEAASVDLSIDPSLALHRAKLALQAAEAIRQPNETGAAWAILVQAAVQSNEIDRTALEQIEAQFDRPALSVRTQIAVDAALSLLQKLTDSASDSLAYLSCQ